MAAQNVFASQLLAWYQLHGRKDLPWQQNITPYRVWLSEIMLQQTQVATVIPFFNRFVEELPTVGSLASAGDDEVMHLWSGLGYYSRARNLHKTASIIVRDYAGKFPADLEALQSLPGIGRSTAAAICATAFEKPAAILDGNVKRVLARHEAIEGWPGHAAVSKLLWQKAEYYTPQNNSRAYTQAIMDLGATVCLRSKPACGICPVKATCVALDENRIEELPGKKPQKSLPVKKTEMLILQRDKMHVLLEKRPPTGIWGGLWSFPESRNILKRVSSTSNSRWPVMRHTFSHFHLDISPVVYSGVEFGGVMEASELLWYNVSRPQSIGLAAPVSKLLKRLRSQT